MVQSWVLLTSSSVFNPFLYSHIHFSSTLFFLYDAMGLTSRVAKTCGGDCNKRPRLAGAGSSSSEPVKCLHRAGMDGAWAAPRLAASELDGVSVPHRANANSEDHGEYDDDVDKWYFWVVCHANGVFTTVRISRDMERK